MEIKFCKNCFYSTQHPLGLTIDQNTGICSGCLIHKEKYQINWNEKLSKLKKIVKEYKSKNNFYDCIVPVSGANDSFYIFFAFFFYTYYNFISSFPVFNKLNDKFRWIL